MSLGTCALLSPEQMGINRPMMPWVPGAPTHGCRSPEWEHQDAGSGNSAADTAHSSCPQCGVGSCHTHLHVSPGWRQTRLGRSDMSLSVRCSHTLQKGLLGLTFEQHRCRVQSTFHTNSLAPQQLCKMLRSAKQGN